jgi:arylsulfatase A-like enzyme
VNRQRKTAQRAGQATWWRWVAANLAPNPRVLLLVALGWTAELVLLACVRDNIYVATRWTRWVAVAFETWFWVTMGWVMWLAGSRLRHPLARVVWGVLLGTVVAVYGLSWGVYLRTSRFLDWDALRFTAGNFRLLWIYARQAEHGARYGAAAILVAAGAAMIGGGSWLANGKWSIDDSELADLRRAQRVTWYCLGLAVLLLLQSSMNLNIREIARWQDALCNCLHPVVTLASNWVSSQPEDRIQPCIDPSELRPLTDAEAWNKMARVTNRASVILITVESMRHDVLGLRHQGLEVTPTVNELANNGVHFTRAYSQATHTDYATTALYSSLFPLRTPRHVYFHSNDPWPKTLFHDVLKSAGYATAIISSQNERWDGLDNFLITPGLDLLYDSERCDKPARGELIFDNLPDSQTVDKAIAWIAEQDAHNTPFFLGLNLQTSHFPYKLPPDARKIFQPSTINFSPGYFSYPIEKVEVVRNAYYNALHECDRQIGRLVEALRRDGQLSRTIIIVSGDHGEAFYEHNYITHAREPIEPVIRTACVVHAPGMIAPHVDGYPVELIDLLPTVLGLLGLPPHPNFQGIDVLARNRPPPAQRLLFFQVENPMARSDAVLWMGRWKYLHDRRLGRASLFDVETDPGENDDLSTRQPELTQSLRHVLETWRRRQLAYYGFPMYYERYFPPLPPTLSNELRTRGAAE